MSIPLIGPVATHLDHRLRRRMLASDQRAGSWARGQVRRRWLMFIRDSWRLLGAMTGVAGALIVTATWAAPNDFLRGAAIGAGVSATASLLMLFVVQATGTAPLSAGASAEQFTASELRPLLKCGWRLINHAGLRRGDIDHLLIGPAGVVVVETKWSATPWDVDAPSSYLHSAIDQAQQNASAVRLWQPVKRAGVEHVWSAVFAWSGFNPDAPAKPTTSQPHGKTQVVYGRKAAASWRTALENAPARLTPEQVDHLWSETIHHLRRRDAHEATALPVPATTVVVFWTLAPPLRLLERLAQLRPPRVPMPALRRPLPATS